MKHMIFSASQQTEYSVAILIKSDAFIKSQIEQFYVKPLSNLGINPEAIIAFNLEYPTTGNLTKAMSKEYCAKLLQALDTLNVQHILVADSKYFTELTKVAKPATKRGYVVDCAVYPYKHMKVVLSSNYNAIFHNDSAKYEIEKANSLLTTSYMQNLLSQTPTDNVSLFSNVIHSSSYPNTTEDIKATLNSLYRYPEITCDIEAYSLRFEQAGIGTIGFAWTMHDGTAFAVDWPSKDSVNHEVRALLKEFFINYQGIITFHNILYDAKVLIYTLFMQHDSDWAGMREGLEVFSKCNDSMIVAYLATNTTALNPLGLKELSHYFSGNYALDVKDITKLELPDLLEYNLIDCLNTRYVLDTYTPLMIRDGQLDFYKNMAMPSVKFALQMMLTGLPIDLDKVHKAEKTLEKLNYKYAVQILSNVYVKQAERENNLRKWEAANAKLKKKIKPISDFNEKFNPGSDLQLRTLLYTIMNLPVLDTTDTGEPSTSSKVIKRLLDTDEGAAHKDLLNAIIGYSETSKILNTFISAFTSYAFTRKTPDEFNGTTWLNGNLKTTGTKSGRLSSSEPNMQNLPSGSTWGKVVKECFVAPKGWLWVSADFASLEDRINALLTKDPNKVKIYTEGYDGHCLRAYSYYKAQMPDIDPTDVHSINSIAEKYPKLRGRSKSPTFALAYLGTWKTLVKNLGFSTDEAKQIEENYHKLYEVSDQVADTVICNAARLGYVPLAFGLKLRTPVLKQTVMSVSKLPNNAAAEGRTANNAYSQSYGLLMNRALIDVQNRLSTSEFINDILMINTIHDAGYFLVRATPEAVKWMNDNLIDAMSWNDDPRIKSTDIPMAAELDVGTTWANGKTIHNNATLEEVTQFLKDNELI